MIELTESGYILRQMKWTRVVHITSPEGKESTIIGPKLTRENAKKIILALGNDLDLQAREV